ncbi:MAG: Hsp20/alpha crystallin family protein [Alphaproteobacteria bacterium]|nr:Hsp20/alpha crystallin family protein [Alphaproteobacteria bacterium]
MTTTSDRRARLDLFESDDAFLVIAEVPGVRAEDLELSVEKDTLSLSATTTEPEPGRVVERQFAPVTWRRSLKLPDGIDAERITARFEDGLLRVDLPRSAAQRRRRIPIGTTAEA